MARRLWRQQLRDVFHVERFPVVTWMLAGSVLVVAWFVDLPNRKRQLAERDLQANLAKTASSPEREVAKVLPGGKLLLRDGSVVDK